MTKEFDKASMLIGAFLRWFDLAINEMTEMKKLNSKHLSFKDYFRLKKAIRRMSKLHKKSEKDFMALLKALEEIDDKEGAEERATEVFRLIRRVFAEAQLEYKTLASTFSRIKFSRMPK